MSANEEAGSHGENGQNKNKKLSISEVIEKMDPPFRDAYNDPSDIPNYSQDGSAFYRKNREQIKDMVKKNAIEHGLDKAQLDDFKNGSKLWESEERKERINSVSYFDVAGQHYEQCRNGFATVVNGKITVFDDFRNDGKLYMPLINDTLTTGQLILPEKPEECDNLSRIIKEIEEKIAKWIYISIEELPIFMVQIRIAICSWFLFVYDDITIQERVAGLLGIVGTSSGGKKRWLTILRQIAYRPIYLLNTNKIPSVFRMAEPWGNPTLLIDEADQKDSGSEAEWVQFINSRYDGTPIPRYNAASEKTDIFRSFGLTCLALRRMPKDEGTTGRMTKINATISPIALPEVAGNDIFQEFEGIRNKLFYLRLKYYGKLKFVGSSGLPAEQSWRGKETLTLFRVLEQIDPAISKDIVEISKSLTEREIQNLAQTWDGLIINEIYSFISDDNAEHKKRQSRHYFYRTWTDKEGKDRESYLNLKYLADRLGTSASEIQRSMAQFKISTFDRFRPNGSGSAQRGILMFAYPQDTDRVFMRYVPGYEHELLKLMENPQDILFSNENDGNMHDSGSTDLVPAVPLVPPHDLPDENNNNNNNNNNSTIDTHVAGTSGTSGTDYTSGSLEKNSGELHTEPSNSDIQNEKSGFKMDHVREYIIELLRDEAPKTKYHSFSQHEIIKFVSDKYPGVAAGPVYDIIKDLYDRGVIFKPSGRNFAYNTEAG